MKDLFTEFLQSVLFVLTQFLQSVLFALVIASPLIAYFWMMKP